MLRHVRPRASLIALLLWPLGVWAECGDAAGHLAQLQSLVQTRHAAQDALVLVRRSAQDFKNLLLRGSDPVLAPMLRQRFEGNAQSYEKRLATLAPELLALPGEGERASLLLQEQVTLLAAYRQALQQHDVRDITQALAADKAVQGADVKTLRALEASVDKLQSLCDAAFESLRAALQSCGR